MTDDGTDALEQALALHATPSRFSMPHERALPRAILTLIRIAAGDAEATANAMARTAEPRQVVVDAAMLYIQHVLFHETADSYRLLGVGPDAGNDTLKEHYRWLMRWLHPDRQPERWEVVYSERVNRAWHSLNSAQRRNDYDAQALAAASSLDARVATAPRRAVKRRSGARVPHQWLPPRLIRNLPTLVLGGLAIAGVISLSLLYWMGLDQRAFVNAASDKLAVANSDGPSAQEEAIRQREAFDERVIELSQPVLPASGSVAKAPIAGRSIASMSASDVPDTASSDLDVQSVTADAVPHAATAPPGAIARIVGSVPTGKREIVISRTDREPPQRPLDAIAPKPIAARAPTVPMLPSVPRDRRAPSPMQAAIVPTASPPATVAPAVFASAAPTVAVAKPDGMSPQHAATVVPHEFEDAYAKGDLSRMMRLFAPNAVDNRGGIDAIQEDYNRLFHESSARELRLDALKWTVQADRIVGSGTFEARIRHHDALLAQSVHGWIQIEAVPIDGRWKIQRLLHRNTE